MKRLPRILPHCCSRRRTRRRTAASTSPVSLLLLALLLLASPSLSAAGRRTRLDPALTITGVHESKDAALSVSLKQQQLDQEQGFDEETRGLDYLPLEELRPSSLERRSLSGPGSSPPQCTSKCGRCFPCRPVHVPIQPGLVKTAEYYPEAWRCKCGNKLFMP